MAKLLRQKDVPSLSLLEAMRIPTAIYENYAGEPTSPLNVAKAVSMQPNSGPFRTLCSAADAYGFTEGGASAAQIKITALGMQILRPLDEGQDYAAYRQALLRPRILGEFLRKYDQKPLPKDEIAKNVLSEMGVPKEKAEEVYKHILEGAEFVGFLQDIKGKKYINLDAVVEAEKLAEINLEDEAPDGNMQEEIPKLPPKEDLQFRDVDEDSAREKRVYISHGKNKKFLEPIQRLLAFGDLESVISVRKQSVSEPVPDKVISDMRSCGAAIIHVEDELRLVDQEAKEHILINQNVLIEIGAAMIQYGNRFILLVKEGVQLPSNLQGLYRVEYSGEELDGDATIRLLEAINELKKHPLPS